MNRRLGGDASLNAPIREDGESGERQDWLVDDSPSQECILVENEELENRRQALTQAVSGLTIASAVSSRRGASPKILSAWNARG